MRHTPLKRTNDGVGTHDWYRFKNGYGASVVRGPYSYGGPKLYELAVLDKDSNICYTTPITDDVIGWLDEDAVDAVLDQIEALPPEEWTKLVEES